MVLHRRRIKLSIVSGLVVQHIVQAVFDASLNMAQQDARSFTHAINEFRTGRISIVHAGARTENEDSQFSKQENSLFP